MEGLPEKKEKKEMRRTIVLLTTMAMTLLVATSVAMAATISCPDNLNYTTKCEGTIGDDKMTGTDRRYGTSDGVDFAYWGDNIFGYEGNDAIYARGGPDRVDGGTGNDLIYGEPSSLSKSGGDDYIVGGPGDDRIAGGPGGDAMYGDDGKDTANFYSSPAAITASLVTNVATGEGPDTMRGIENLVGSKYNDTLTGSIGHNTLRGYEGKDSYYGGPDDDTIDAVDSNADGIISCGDGYDTVRYDRYLDVPDGDCESKRPSTVVDTTVVDTSYTADSNPDLINPERGMYFGVYPTGTQSHTIVPKWLYLDTVCNQNLTWNGYNQTGTSAVLNAYAATLEEARTKGVKVLFRPRYDTPDRNAPSSCGLFHADTMVRQRNHIDAVAAMLGDYRDVIAFIQAGYLGRWGEWNTDDYSHSTAPFLYSTSQRNEIIDYVLAAYAAENIQQDLELRRPVFAKEVIDRNATANIGLHNDCFMTTSSDMGTYSNFEDGNPSNFASSAAAKVWAQSFTANVSFGGETCPASGGGERWRSCSNMIGSSSEPASLHMNYLNHDYADDAVSTWTSGGCYPEIKRRLGYRFEVTRVEYTPTVPAGQTFQVRVDVKNTGWAKLHKPRQAKLVLRNGSTTHVYNVSSGAVASWAPGQTTTISVNAPAPSAGTYSVRLWIPDPDAQSRIPYAVKLATLRNSANVFDPNTGENNLGVSITVQ